MIIPDGKYKGDYQRQFVGDRSDRHSHFLCYVGHQVEKGDKENTHTHGPWEPVFFKGRRNGISAIHNGAGYHASGIVENDGLEIIDAETLHVFKCQGEPGSKYDAAYKKSQAGQVSTVCGFTKYVIESESICSSCFLVAAGI